MVTCERLLQHGYIAETKEVTTPCDIPAEHLADWYEIAQKICTELNYNAVAFNQFPYIILRELGFNAPPKIAYFSKSFIDQEPFGELAINPRIICRSQQEFINLEGCGSILDPLDGFSLFMFVIRPALVEISGYFWKSGYSSSVPFTYEKTGHIAAIIEHELDHLNGGTAISMREILDYRDLNIWDKFINSLQASEREKYTSHHKLFNFYGIDRILVPNKAGGFDILNCMGDLIRKYL